MSVEDFFTLTEMTEGLSTLTRVEELISAMGKQKDRVPNIDSEASRQWSNFIGTLAATENMDCLNHFVHLNGLSFLNQWLQQSQKCGNDANNNNMQEGFIRASLAVLDKLPIGREKLTFSGIGITVEHLLDHKSLDIKEKAKKLSDKWNVIEINNHSSQSKTSADTPLTKDLVHADKEENNRKQCEVESIVSNKLMSTILSNSAGTDPGLGGSNTVGSSLSPSSCTGRSGKVVSSGSNSDQRDISVVREVFDDKKELEVDVSIKSGVKESHIASPSPLSDLPEKDLKGSEVVATPIDTSVAKETEKSSQMDRTLESEEIDPLEMARQVALKVEREVVDSREPFCSSPEANSEENLQIPSPESKQNEPLSAILDDNLSPVEKNSSIDKFSLKASKPQEHEQPSESPKLASIAHGSASEFGKNVCDFDLNEDISTEEFHCSMDQAPNVLFNLSAPKAVVATSKGALSLPFTPLQFEGEMGWKGSAATSAFRPPSPRTTPECDKACSDTKKLNFLGFDLNVVDSEQDMAVEPLISAKQLPVSPGLPSGDSSVEVSSRRAEMLKLDLNRLGEEEMPVNPSSHWRLNHPIGDQNLSSASSSSSRQPSMRDFDLNLNDNPCFLDAGGSSKVSTTNYDPDIPIMGSRMAAERADYLTPTHSSFLANGMNIEATMMNAHLPYGHMLPSNGYAGYPSGQAFLFPPSLYGPPGSIPYMVDARGAAVLPQTLPNGVSSVRPHFFASGAHSSMYGGGGGAGPSRSGFDLNSCMTSVESGSREGGSFKQLFTHGHDELVEEQTRISLQPSSSAMSLKRKEPECGWEPYAVGYNQMSSWQ